MTTTREPASPADGARLPAGQTHLPRRPVHWTNLPVPGPVERRAAWDGLPEATKARIGALALETAFQWFLAADAYAPHDACPLNEEACEAAEQRSSEALDELYEVVEAALPDIFGAPGEYPAWAVQH